MVGLDQHTSVFLLLSAYLLIGVGFGFANAPITNTAVSGLPASRAGVAGAITSTARQLGSALGIAIMRRPGRGHRPDGTRTRVPPGLDPGRHLRTVPSPRGARGAAEEGHGSPHLSAIEVSRLSQYLCS